MGIEIREGCIFEAFDRGIVSAIAHQTNVDGAMGAGIAREIAARYPSVLADFKALKSPMLGQVLASQLKDDKIVFNVYAQSLFPRNQLKKTNYEALYNGFKIVADYCNKANIRSLGVPFNLGCGHGGGNWGVVKAIFNCLFENNDRTNLIIFEKKP